MKKYSIIALFVALVVSLSSCNDDFMQRNPIDDMADGTFFTKEADLQLYLDGIYRYYVYGHGHGGTNSTTHDKGFLAVKAGSQIIFGDAFSDNTVYAGDIDGWLQGYGGEGVDGRAEESGLLHRRSHYFLHQCGADSG